MVQTAARLFRERGIQGVSVADLMAEAGLTHGGFYKQFASKEALVAEAVALAFEDLGADLHDRDQQHPGDHEAAREAFVAGYLSAAHRDDPGNGCATTGFGTDVAREPPDSPAREPFAAGVAEFAAWLGPTEDEALVTLATMVGALLIARATAGTPLADRILAAATSDLSGKGRVSR
ncbi:TetR family transcriptional regulator [Actinoplanes sp. N902-109]|nr:TetR family transcriptional regulator [Actinoplanes sp. N902-109]